MNIDRKHNHVFCLSVCIFTVSGTCVWCVAAGSSVSRVALELELEQCSGAEETNSLSRSKRSK